MIADHQSAHKVGTDGVLLGAWVRINEEDKFILDIGTGSGLIALMLAQRTGPGTRIDAVEIESTDARQAAQNITDSPWPEKIHIHNLPVQQHSPGNKYDLIVSNPPYFVNSWLPPGKKRSQARHTQELSYEDLLRTASRLLAPQGRLGVIFPYAEGLNFLDLAKTFDLFPVRKTTFRSRAQKPVERLLVELAYDRQLNEDNELVLYSEGENWSDEYKALTREFYLKV